MFQNLCLAFFPMDSRLFNACSARRWAEALSYIQNDVGVHFESPEARMNCLEISVANNCPLQVARKLLEKGLKPNKVCFLMCVCVLVLIP